MIKRCAAPGLDYWSEVKIHYHLNIEALYAALPDAAFYTSRRKRSALYTDFHYAPNDCLVFGRETRGLPEDLLRANWERCLTIPMPNKRMRSLNLATSVGIALYEAIRQTIEVNDDAAETNWADCAKSRGRPMAYEGVMR